ncbi:transcription factor HES-5-like [Lissotriton helveticus]
MAPSSLYAHSEEGQAPKDKNKLRKPAVEKVRRDRINRCIEQLRLLLQAEFQTQQPNSKLEKADILEVAVRCLRQHCLHQTQVLSVTSSQKDFDQGYLSCLTQSVHFLSYCQPNEGTQIELIKYFDKTRPLIDNQPKIKSVGGCQSSKHCIAPFPTCQGERKLANPNTERLWRPW